MFSRIETSKPITKKPVSNVQANDNVTIKKNTNLSRAIRATKKKTQLH